MRRAPLVAATGNAILVAIHYVRHAPVRYPLLDYVPIHCFPPKGFAASTMPADTREYTATTLPCQERNFRLAPTTLKRPSTSAPGPPRSRPAYALGPSQMTASGPYVRLPGHTLQLTASLAPCLPYALPA